MRAYPVGEATADSGVTWQTELRWVIPGTKVLGGDLTAFGFFDYGAAQINQEPAKDPTTGAIVDSQNIRSFSGYGLGGSAGKEGDFLLRIMASWAYTYNEQPQSDTARRVPTSRLGGDTLLFLIGRRRVANNQVVDMPFREADPNAAFANDLGPAVENRKQDFVHGEGLRFNAQFLDQLDEHRRMSGVFQIPCVESEIRNQKSLVL